MFTATGRLIYKIVKSRSRAGSWPTRLNVAGQTMATRTTHFPGNQGSPWQDQLQCQGLTEGCMSICRPSSRCCWVRFSMATGAGPTPARRHISPQKAWSPKNGSVIVGHPAARPVPVVPAVSDTCMSAFTKPGKLTLVNLRVCRCSAAKGHFTCSQAPRNVAEVAEKPCRLMPQDHVSLRR